MYFHLQANRRLRTRVLFKIAFTDTQGDRFIMEAKGFHISKGKCGQAAGQQEGRSQPRIRRYHLCCIIDVFGCSGWYKGKLHGIKI